MIDLSTGVVLDSTTLNWHEVDIRERLTRRFHAPVFVGNDADVAALGEWMVGVAKNVQNFVYISSNVGIGGGLVLNGRPYKGENGIAGEIGHMCIDPAGPRCTCGSNGCLEAYIRPEFVVNHLKDAARKRQTPELLRLCKNKTDSINMDLIVQAAEAGDKYVVEYMDQIARYLGIGIASLINIFNPKMIVIGGVLSIAGQSFHNAVELEAKQRITATYRPDTQIVSSLNGFDAGAVGGVALVLDALLQNPAQWQAGLVP